ncbi:MAG: peptidoglycan-binding protein [Candidatus Liptonbacteria bacterium]|nr:peptidoglycan-binding protein [Candidatus Liptonbacteria bacterium]
MLSGLKPGTSYYYKAVSRAASETAQVENQEFTTLAVVATPHPAPKISNVAVESFGTSTATIIWTTDISADSEVEFGSTGTQVTPSFRFTRNLAAGSQNLDVFHLQLILKNEAGIYPSGLLTGYFGPLTQKALTRFQIKRKLEPTGRADEKTRVALENFSRRLKIESNTLTSIFERDLAVGQSGSDVLALQQFLIDQNFYPEKLLTGYFGELTRQALIRFQQAQNITPAQGYFGPVTREALQSTL